MKYLRVKWLHEFIDEPVIMYYEIDDNSIELRKIELFKNGKVGYADFTYQINGSYLSEGQFPDIEEIRKLKEFIVEVISKNEFEKVFNEKVEVLLLKQEKV